MGVELTGNRKLIDLIDFHLIVSMGLYKQTAGCYMDQSEYSSDTITNLIKRVLAAKLEVQPLHAVLFARS